MANPRRRRSYRRNPISMEQVFGGYGVDDVALAAGAMVLIQKVQEMLPLNMRTGFADPISAAAVTGVGVMVLKGAEPKLARALGMGGGIATALKVVAQIPALNSFVSPGSLVIGRHVPMLSTPSIAPLPSGKVVASAPAPQVRL